MTYTVWNPRRSRRLVKLAQACLCLLLAGGLLAGPATSQEEEEPAGAYQNLSVEDLQEVVGPFALYPDELVRYILPASTHQEDVLAAAAILTRTGNKPEESDPEVKKLHESVQALLPFPDVIEQFAEFPDWLGELGDAVAYQEADVMDAVQLFRQRAHEAGNLETTEQQTVIVEQKVIRVVPANPEIIYVPVYQPTVVVVRQPAPVITFGVGIAVGYLIWGGHHWGHWGGCHWNHKTTINIHGGVYRRPPGYRRGYHSPGNRPANRPGYRPGARPGAGPGSRPVNRTGASRPGSGNRPSTATRPSTRPSTTRPSTTRPSTTRPSSVSRPTTTRQPSSGAFGGSSRGSSARTHSSRGASSRGVSRPSAGGSRGGRR